MFDEHARVLKYICWVSAALFAFGVVVEGMKQQIAEPVGVTVLLAVIGGLCAAMAAAEYRADQKLARTPRQ